VSCTAPLACTATGTDGISTGANGVAGVFVASTLASTATAESLSTGNVTYWGSPDFAGSASGAKTLTVTR